ncbi:MAG: tRNA(Arg) A34 adenosine deaminase TadA [Candidatus Krumholzibacteriia bacterium]|jgi:tRNA(Arg) A34 adenosine deaminase TadA
MYPDIKLSLPAWVAPFIEDQPDTFPSDVEKMDLVVALSLRNLVEKTGGPFGAAVFDATSHQLVAPGVNLVVTKFCSAAHAEVVALSMAQQVLQTHDLGAEGQPAHTLVSSTEPCAMCLGAVPWSGVTRLVCGATGEDAEKIGMDEGAKPADWVETLTERGIAVTLKVRRVSAAAVLNDYAASGAEIYNGRKGA